jgi:hypothetical protein
MQAIQQIKTFDGKIHPNIEAAHKHLEVMHADVLCKIAHEIVQLNGKYAATGDWIDKNLGRFLDLYAIKQDMKIEINEDDHE